VFVTHDVDEAIRLGDRIAVMREGGHLEQYAEPSAVLSDPATPYVAEFVGAERTLRRLSVAPVSAAQLVAWPSVRPDASLADCVSVMDRADAQWAVVDAPGSHAWLSRTAAIDGTGTVSQLADSTTTVAVGESLEKALAAILSGNAPGAIVTDDGRYAGVLLATDVVAAARSRT
jgi:osmoprotectant transport system ATP-binding protein